MNRTEREALEAAGFRVGTAAEFLGMDESDRKYVEFRLSIVRAVHRLRTAQNLSQQALADRIGSSQPRVAKIEAGAPGVSLDLAARALFALGGGLDDLWVNLDSNAQGGPQKGPKRTPRRPETTKAPAKSTVKASPSRKASASKSTAARSPKGKRKIEAD
jgi:transcriptional regulator with XRE-family HTH domain